MHIELEISNVSGRVEIGGVSQPVISQKKIVHDIRMREGEVNLLGGLDADTGYADRSPVFRGSPNCRCSAASSAPNTLRRTAANC